jgi:hypothetical protein
MVPMNRRDRIQSIMCLRTPTYAVRRSNWRGYKFPTFLHFERVLCSHDRDIDVRCGRRGQREYGDDARQDADGGPGPSSSVFRR